MLKLGKLFKSLLHHHVVSSGLQTVTFQVSHAEAWAAVALLLPSLPVLQWAAWLLPGTADEGVLSCHFDSANAQGQQHEILTCS